MGTIQFFDEPCTFDIKRGVVALEWPSGERLAFPLDVFRIQLARAIEAINEHDARNAAILPFRRKKRRRDHAATS